MQDILQIRTLRERYAKQRKNDQNFSYKVVHFNKNTFVHFLNYNSYHSGIE